MRTYQNFIGGEWTPAKSGKTCRNVNPADTREVVAEYASSGKEDAVAAIEAAKKAFAGWGAMTPVARGRILSKASQILETRKTELTGFLTREEGKTLSESAGELAGNSMVAALSFTGSYSVGSQIYRQLAQRMARGQMEMGGKNPTLVLADADLDLAARLVAIAGFGLTGQACTATSRVIVEKSVADAFAQKLIERAKTIQVGNGLREGVTMGPAVSKQQLAGNLEYVDIALAEGAKLLYGGQRLTEDDYAHGHFMQPTILGNVSPKMRIACEEVFGPVVGIITVDNFDEAIAAANGVDVGLSASIVTRDLRKAMLYTERIEAGVGKVNQ